jgi:SsrA-binding protein
VSAAKSSKSKAPVDPRNKTVASNRKARHDFEILETWECGISLVGSEVKSLRDAKVQLRDSYARVDEAGELWLHGVHISPYAFSFGRDGHDPDRRRKLLAHRAEIVTMADRVAREGLALVPLAIYFKEGRAKVELGLGRGRRLYDKRVAIAKKDAEREAARERRGRERTG